MRATEILSAEHRVIEQVLDCLEVMLQRAETSGRFDPADVRQAVGFFRCFADQCHHGKEEVHLFPAMEAHGFPRVGGPTGVMLQEHELGRRCVRGLAAAADSGDLQEFLQHGRAYVQLLRQHIQKEDHCLFAMADQALSTDDQEQLLAAFERVEHEELGPETHQHWINVANELATRYEVPVHTASLAGHHCCG
jgi:hemerythrin-like domain-containing protein